VKKAPARTGKHWVDKIPLLPVPGGPDLAGLIDGWNHGQRGARKGAMATICCRRHHGTISSKTVCVKDVAGVFSVTEIALTGPPAATLPV
jgi:hypothetical protein